MPVPSAVRTRHLLATLLLAGCSHGEPEKPADSGEDTGAVDSAGPPDDTASDTDTADSAPPDTDTADTGTADTDTDPEEPAPEIDVSTAGAEIRGLRHEGGTRPVAGPGDLDGDGLDDIVVTSVAPYPDTDSVVYVYTAPSGVLEVTDAYATRESDAWRMLQALSVRRAGDLTGSGTATLAIGSAAEGGRVLLWGSPLRGDTAGASTATAAIVDAGATSLTVIPGDHLGPGDLDGDGADDLVVSLYDGTTYGDHPETTWVLRGPFAGVTDVTDAATTITSSAVDHQGDARSLAALGDTDGDGLADFALADTLARRAYVYADLPLGSVERADAAAGTVAMEIQATLVEGAGDLDGDGYPELAVGAWASDPSGRAQAGRVAIHRGPLTGEVAEADVWAAWEGDRAYLSLGCSVAGVGDTDGDGRDDLLVGSHDGAWLVVGPAPGTWTASDATARYTDASGLTVGRYVAPAGDTDGDGLADLLVYAYDLGGSRAAAYLFPGGSW